MKEVKCDLCSKSYLCQNHRFFTIELFEDEYNSEGHQKSLDCLDICKKCWERLKNKPFQNSK